MAEARAAGELAGYLIDSNVLLDVATRDNEWFEWSASTLADIIRSGPVFINALIYSEVSARYASIDELDAALPASVLRRRALPFSAGFLASKAFVAYRGRGGEKRSPLPDFYIGAHAVVENLALVTRDARRYRTYFPTLRVVSPE
jgi:predicted nucleic acid-binding protein